MFNVDHKSLSTKWPAGWRGGACAAEPPPAPISCCIATMIVTLSLNEHGDWSRNNVNDTTRAPAPSGTIRPLLYVEQIRVFLLPAGIGHHDLKFLIMIIPG